MKWLWREDRQHEPPEDRVRTWELSAAHTLHQRAKILAEIAFADFANDRHGMTERAAFRIAGALEKYTAADAEFLALAQPEAPASLAEGWVLVPKEPTDEMLETGGAFFANMVGDPYNSWSHFTNEAKAVYRAMLAALARGSAS